MKFAVAALLGATSAFGLNSGDVISETEYKFMSFISEHQRSYGTVAEYKFRLAQFEKRVAEHERFNAIEGQTSTQGVNHLTDRTDDEIKMLNGFKEMPTKTEMNYAAVNATDSSPIDWRAKGAVTPVKNQGQCGSCWSFSTTGAMEGAHFVSSGKLLSLSESNLVDCSWLNHGCNGGMMDLAFKYAESYPLETEIDYPYVAHTGLFACKYDKSKGQVKVTTYTDVKKNSAAAMKSALQGQPVSVAIEADQPVFHQYTGGIITSDSCGTSLDHGVLAVGYGVESGQEYYIVKNSWTADWGEKGYVRIGIKDGAGICGIHMSASFPTTN
jgi:C1A family cysteine protease